MPAILTMHPFISGGLQTGFVIANSAGITYLLLFTSIPPATLSAGAAAVETWLAGQFDGSSILQGVFVRAHVFSLSPFHIVMICGQEAADIPAVWWTN